MSDRRSFRLPLGRYLPPMGSAFVYVEVLGGVILLGATIAALTWANISFSSYQELWSTHLTIGVGDLAVTESLQGWVNDGLMTVFFFVVGLEIKREVVRGELRDPRTASLPVIAAIGGMVVPALLYLAINAGGPGGRGWAIPMATDIAFAVAVLAIAGSRVPGNLKLFLLTLAIVDDIGAIIVIAIFYSGQISATWLLGAAGTILVIVGLQQLKLRHAAIYVIPAVVLWVCVLESGVHATIAGVLLGLLTPARKMGGREIIEPLEARLHPWSSFLIVPLFALANAGVYLGGGGISQRVEQLDRLGHHPRAGRRQAAGDRRDRRTRPSLRPGPAPRGRPRPPPHRRGGRSGDRLHGLTVRRRPLVRWRTTRRREGRDPRRLDPQRRDRSDPPPRQLARPTFLSSPSHSDRCRELEELGHREREDPDAEDDQAVAGRRDRKLRADADEEEHGREVHGDAHVIVAVLTLL